MAGTVTVTQVPVKSIYGREIQKYQVDWTSDASGNATGSITLYGWLVKAVTSPGATTPSAYGVTLIGPDAAAVAGADELGGLLAARSTTATEIKYMTISPSSEPIFLAGAYTFTIASAGNAKNGTAWFYMVDQL